MATTRSRLVGGGVIEFDPAAHVASSGTLYLLSQGERATKDVTLDDVWKGCFCACRTSPRMRRRRW
jgi:hypothetical protein